MTVKLGKWEKGEMKRIYFNSEVLNGHKVYAFKNKEGAFEMGRKYLGDPSPYDRKFADKVEQEAIDLLEARFGRPIDYRTNFDDVWAVLD